MDFTHFMITILSGIVGTVAMTAVMYLYSVVTKKNTKVIHILGSMLVAEDSSSKLSRNSMIVGIAGHFGVGILFSFAYFLLWNWGVFRINLPDSILIGAASGVVAIIVWKSYLHLYNHPPKISQLHYFIALFLAHIIFGIVSVNVFQLVTDNPELWYQLQDQTKAMK